MTNVVLVEPNDVDMDWLVKHVPERVVSTLFDSLFLDGNSSKTIAKELRTNESVLDAISGGALYGTTISKPWFKELPFSSIAAYVHGSVVNQIDRHLLDCIIAVGHMLPAQILNNGELGYVIDYYGKYLNKQQPGSFSFDYDLNPLTTRAAFSKKVFSEQYIYYCVEVDELFPLIPYTISMTTKRTFKERLDALGLTEFRLKFLDDAGDQITVAKMKLIEPVFYPFNNMAKYSRQKTQLTEDSYSHVIVGIASGYIKSLYQHSTLTRTVFKQVAGITGKCNLQDFVKWLYPNKRSYIAHKSMKSFIKQYYEDKAHQGRTYITTKVNRTFNQMIDPSVKPLVENALGGVLEVQFNEKNNKPYDAKFIPSKTLENLTRN